MDNYSDRNRLSNYQLTLAKLAANQLRNDVYQAASRHLKNSVSRTRFKHEIETFITAQIQGMNNVKSDTERQHFLTNLKTENQFIIKQDRQLRMKSARLCASARLVKKEDYWGYIINGVGVVLSGSQVITGAGIIIASLSHGNIIGMLAGAALTLHGFNGLQESIGNIRTGRSDKIGFLKEGYINTAKFMGFDSRVGLIAYSTVDITLSAYGLTRLIQKPESWRLFRNLPSDYIRNIKTMGAPSLILEGVGDGISLKTAYDSYNQ